MSDPVQLSVRSSLSKIIDEMDAIRKKTAEVRDEFKSMGNDVSDNLKQNTKKTETFLGQLRSLSRRVADQLRGDFKSLIGVNALQESLRLSNQFKGSIRETVALSDAIRKLGTTFGIADKNFVSFQTKMVKGLGQIGLSSEVASRTLEGLLDTPVRGEDSLIGYSQQAGMLASVSRQQGREGDIAKGIAKVIQARGGDVNDLEQVGRLSEDLRKVFNQTGKGPAETLRVMEDLFTSMPKDLRQSISSAGLTNLAAASAIGGPNATKFLEEYLGKSPIARMAFDAQGGGGIFGDNGINTDKFAQFAKGIMGRIGGDPRLAAQTLGLSEEAAEGFVRLAENLDKVTDAQNRINASTGSLAEQYRKSMGFGEAFRANINRVKAVLAAPLSWISQKGSDVMSGASQSDLGSAGVVAGGGLLAALLAGVGTRALGGSLLGSLGKGAAASALTGQEVQPVYVVNAAEIAAGGLAGKAGGALGLLGKAGLVGAAGAAGVGIGAVANMGLDKFTTSTSSDGEFSGNLVERLFYKLDRLSDGMLSGVNYKGQQKVMVELNKRDLKESKQPTRGSSF